VGAVSYLQEFIVSLILYIPHDQQYVSYGARVNTHIIQAHRTPLVTTRGGPVAILPGWEGRDDMIRCVPWFHLAQSGSEVRQTLKRVIKILIALYNEGMNDCGGWVKRQWRIMRN
jgi:hypothetical protein